MEKTLIEWKRVPKLVLVRANAIVAVLLWTVTRAYSDGTKEISVEGGES